MKKHLLIIGFTWPEPDTTAAGVRMLQLINLFNEWNYEISFVSTSVKTEKSFLLEKLNIQTFEIQLNNSSFDNLAKNINPNIVIFDRYITEEQFGWRIIKNCPKAIRILDAEDLHFLRTARQQAFDDKKSTDLTYLTNNITKREIASIYRCDLSLIISKYEINLLIKTFKVDASILIYFPFLIKKVNNSIFDSFPPFSHRKHFISIGNFKHKPNLNAVNYLKKVLWPPIRKKLPNIEIHIYGAYASKKVMELHNQEEGFIIKGWARSSEEVFKNARICLAPIQFGAGLKGKLIDAMRFGTPSITTEIGAEAMHNDLPWNGYITNSPDEFVDKSIELYKNEQDWLNTQKNGITILNECYDREKFSKILLNAISKINFNLEEHRLQNFIGAMLQHHSLNSTKYLSKWIEEKNLKY